MLDVGPRPPASPRPVFCRSLCGASILIILEGGDAIGMEHVAATEPRERRVPLRTLQWGDADWTVRVGALDSLH